MNRLALFATTAVAALGALHAQSPLNTLSGGTNQGNVGGGIYFDLQVHTTITLTQIDFRCGATTVAGTGTLDVFVGPSTYDGNVTNPALWTFVTNATAPVAPSAVSTGTLATPIGLAPGNYGIALKSNAFSHGYTNGVTCTSNTIPGSCSNSLFSNTELTLRGGAAQNAFLSGGIFTPRIFNGALHYTLGGTPIRVAAWETYGSGCDARYRSFYQLFPNPAGLNLGTGQPVQALHLALVGGTYHVTAVNSPVVAPTSTPVVLSTGDESFLASSVLPLPFGILYPVNGAPTPATDLQISTEGYIVPSPGTIPNDVTPAVNDFLASAARWAPHWKNMNPLAAGSMHCDFDSTSGQYMVTWNAVSDNGGTSTFQVAFYPTGDVEFRYGAMSLVGGGGFPVIVGWTEGGGALDPGNFEIVTSLPFDTESSDNRPLGLGLSARPLLGSTVNLVTTSIPAGTGVGAMLLGIVDIAPPIDLAVIQMPRCFLHVNGNSSVTFSVSGATAPFPLLIPNIPILNGGILFGQSVTVSSGFNPLGVISSNGVRMHLGTL